MDTTFPRRGPSGTAVYLERLVPELRALGVDVVEAANARRPAPAGGGAGSVRNLAADRAWTALGLAGRARAAGAGLVHHPLPAGSRAIRVPQVVTVHDLAFERLPERFDARFRAYARRAHRSAARRAAVVIAVSHATAQDVREHWGIDPARIVVAPHGPGQAIEPAPARTDPPTHFLYVGDDEPRKRVDVLLDAYRRFRAAGGDAPLLLAGSVADPAIPGVETVSRPSPQRLAQLHAESIALLHPAIEEGFGLTLLEALAAGTPVIAARSRAALEVCGDAALLLDADDGAALAASLADAMTVLADDAGLRQRLADAGLARSRDFTWTASARAHIEAYTLALQ
jgi:glycosyltransferase involved in cell wall biosynthesis